MGYSKAYKKQYLKSSRLVFVMCLLIACAAMTGWIIFKAIENNKRVAAYKTAENLSKNIYPQLMEPSRSPSSTLQVQELGEDPWGRPYRWASLNSAQSQEFVVVWSAGPNGRYETNQENFTVGEGGYLSNVYFAGDDVGYVRSVQE